MIKYKSKNINKSQDKKFGQINVSHSHCLKGNSDYLLGYCTHIQGSKIGISDKLGVGCYMRGGLLYAFTQPLPTSNPYPYFNRNKNLPDFTY